jgi:hypothetical protein
MVERFGNQKSYNLLLGNYNMQTRLNSMNIPVKYLQIHGIIAFTIMILVVLTSVAIPFAWGDSINPGLYSIDTNPYSISYGQWTAKWWQWLLSTPLPNSPLTDTTGKDCGQNQNGAVWFLVGTEGGAAARTCTIPAGKAILFPIINSECSYSERPTLKTESDLAKCAKVLNNPTTNLQASVDGVNLQQLDKYRVTSPLFNLTFPAKNIFGSPVGTTQAVGDGWFIIMHPLPPGKHELHFSGLTPANPTTGQSNFSVDLTYHLLVQ